jgi:hypothetical protein
VGVCVVATAVTVPATVPAATARPVVVDPATLPRGPMYAGAWADLRKQVVHRPGPDLAVRLSGLAWNFGDVFAAARSGGPRSEGVFVGGDAVE